MNVFIPALKPDFRVLAWRENLPWPAKLALAFLMACMTGLFAQIRLPLPFTPVPLTGQVFAVLVSGALLGARHGALSQLFYAGLGCAGIGWFANPALLGPTGGYLLGFVLAASLLGFATERSPFLRRPFPLFGLMLAAVGLIYAAGAAQFSLFMGTGPRATLAGAVLPFIPADILKAMAAAALCSALLKKD